MSVSTKYQVLNEMGIPIWLSRDDFFSTQKDHILLCAHCLVLLPENPALLSDNEQKTLQGMLKVLDLDFDNIEIAWFTPSEPEKWINAVLKWAPHTILIMGKTFSETWLSKESLHLNGYGYCNPIQVTYHPKELAQDPNNRAKAYQDLLTLKEYLQHHILKKEPH